MAHHLSCGVAPQRCRLLRIDLLEPMLSSQLVEYPKEERKRVRQRAVEVEDGQSISHLSSHSIQLQPGGHRNSKSLAGCWRLRASITTGDVYSSTVSFLRRSIAFATASARVR